MCEFYRVFDSNVIISDIYERSDMMFDSKEIAQRALVLAGKKAAHKRKYIKIAASASSVCAVFLFFFITVYAIPLFYVSPDNSSADYYGLEDLIYEDFAEDVKIPLSGFFPAYGEPVFAMPEGEFIFIDGTLELGLLLENPAENACYLTFELVLADTGEALYQSYMVAPALRIETVRLSRILERGAYQVILTVRAYDSENFSEIAGEKTNLYLIFE